MPKRKRSDDDTSVETIFSRFRDDLYQALKTVRGFERQRQSKRLRDAKSTPDKKARIENEVVVLKVRRNPTKTTLNLQWASIMY